MTVQPAAVAALYVRVGQEVRTSLGWRRVVDTARLNRGGAVLLVLEAPEAPQGTLPVAFPASAQVFVHAQVDARNLRDVMNNRGTPLPRRR